MIRAALTAAGLLLASVTAHAWESDYKWGVQVVGYRVNPTNLDVTNAQALAAIRFGADAWTKQTKAAFRFRYDGTTSATTSSQDYKNVVLFRNAYAPTSSTARGTAYKWIINNKIIETDIVFWDAAISFVTGSMTCSGDIYIENTAIHEFGHGLGLEHTPVTTATMYKGAPACDKSRLTLDADDKAGALALYPCSTSSQCNDANICTKDTCSSSKCLRTAIAGCCTATSQCGDGNACTKDSCDNNVCKNTPIAGCCTANAQCDDGKPCTKDTCSSNVCKNAPIAGCCTANAQCDDGKPCTKDTCSSNVCKNAPITGCCPGGCDTAAVDTDASIPDVPDGPDGQIAPAASDRPTVGSNLGGSVGQDAGINTSSTPHLTDDIVGSGCALVPSGRDGSWGLVLVALLLLVRKDRRGLGYARLSDQWPALRAGCGRRRGGRAGRSLPDRPSPAE